MIIKSPTGLYKNVLPQSASEVGDVTFTISNTAPPRANLLFPKLPLGTALRQRGDRLYTASDRRAAVAELVFTTSSSSRSAAGSAAQQYETGQVLEFDDVEDVLASVQPLLVGDSSEIRHDTGLLDYNQLGLSADQTALITALANTKYTDLQWQLEAARQQYMDTAVAITSNQKAINENARATAALQLLADQATIAPILAALAETQVVLQQDKTTLIAQANSLSTTCTTLMDELRQLAQIVR